MSYRLGLSMRGYLSVRTNLTSLGGIRMRNPYSLLLSLRRRVTCTWHLLQNLRRALSLQTGIWRLLKILRLRHVRFLGCIMRRRLGRNDTRQICIFLPNLLLRLNVLRLLNLSLGPPSRTAAPGLRRLILAVASSRPVVGELGRRFAERSEAFALILVY